jgi:uncharacterized protein (TIGR03067 family)
MRLTVALLLSSLPLSAAPAPFLPQKMTPAEADMKSLQGEWELVRDNTDGRELKVRPGEDVRVFRGRILTILVDGVVNIVWRITLDTSRSPRLMRHAQEPGGGGGGDCVYALDGDTLTLAYLHNAKEAARLTPGEGVSVLVFRRKRP